VAEGKPVTLACTGGTRWSSLAPGLSLAELGIGVAALQGLRVHSKAGRVRGLQVRKVLVYSGSLWWSGHGEVVPEGQ